MWLLIIGIIYVVLIAFCCFCSLYQNQDEQTKDNRVKLCGWLVLLTLLYLAFLQFTYCSVWILLAGFIYLVLFFVLWRCFVNPRSYRVTLTTSEIECAQETAEEIVFKLKNM